MNDPISKNTRLDAVTTQSSDIPDYLTFAVLSTIFCNFIAGVVAIIYASKARAKKECGDIQAAIAEAQKAKKWCWVAVGAGIILAAILLFSKLYQYRETLILHDMKEAKMEIVELSTSLVGYYLDLGHFPTSVQGLKALIKRPSGSEGAKWKGPYINNTDKLVDPWGRKYHYRYPGIYNQDSYDLWSNGGDNREGGQGTDADIRNWD